MRERQRTLVVGIGSPHADDQAGWLLIERLSERRSSGIQMKKAKLPYDLLDWIDDCEELHIVDACDAGQTETGQTGPGQPHPGQNEPGQTDSGPTLYRLDNWQGESPSSLDQRMRSHSSHQLGIGSVIQLGRALGRFPDRVIVWGIPGKNFGPGQSVSDSCRRHVDHCAAMLTEELLHA